MVNRVTLLGNCARDTELIFTQGKPMARLRIATSSSWRGRNGERQESTDFHSVVAFDKLAEIAQQHCLKGRLVYLEGRLHTREYAAADGTRRFATEVIADVLRLAGSPVRLQEKPEPQDDAVGPEASDSPRQARRRRA